jgi:uncharacterized protein (TIGR03437 family)
VGSLFAQPAVNDGGILNAASYVSSKLPSGAIAQGSIFVVFGARMGGATLTQAGFPLPTTLAGTNVKVTSGGQTLDCPLVYVSAGQLAAILPSTTPVGNATLTVTYNGQTSTARSFRVVNSSFGTFSLNQAGSGPGVITNFESATSQPVNTVLKPARSGQTLILYGTGLGPLPSGSDSAPAPAVEINRANVELYVGTTRATVAYAGRAPGFAGLDQINFVVPAGITGCAIPVSIKTGNQVSNYTTIAISSGGNTCTDALGLPASQLERLSSTGSLKVGVISLARIDLEVSVLGFTTNVKTDTGVASFVEYTPTNIVSSSSLNAAGAPSIGTCTVYAGTSTSLTPVDPLPPRGLDAGGQINITGPKGAKILKKTLNLIGNYSETLSSGGVSIPGFPGGGDGSYLEAGAYSFNNGAGGADVRAFTANATLSAPVNWTNKSQIVSVNRASGQTVTWTPGSANGYVVIYGYSASDASESAILGVFTCTAPASAGTFTVPASVLLTLPATPGSNSVATPLSVLGVGSGDNPTTFTAPGLDYAYIVNSSVAVKTVTYQ